MHGLLLLQEYYLINRTVHVFVLSSLVSLWLIVCQNFSVVIKVGFVLLRHIRGWLSCVRLIPRIATGCLLLLIQYAFLQMPRVSKYCNLTVITNQLLVRCTVRQSKLFCFMFIVISRSYGHGLVMEGLRERTEYIDILIFFRPSLNRVLFPMFCLLVEGECQILVF